MKSAGLRDAGVLGAPVPYALRRGGTCGPLEGVYGLPCTMIARPSAVRAREVRRNRRRRFELPDAFRTVEPDSADDLSHWLSECSRQLGFVGAAYVHLGHIPSDARQEPEWRPVRSLAVGAGLSASPVAIEINDRFLPFEHLARGGMDVESWLVVPVQDHAAGSAWLAFAGSGLLTRSVLERHGPELAYAGARFHGIARNIIPCSAGGSGKGLTEREIECLRYAAQGLTLERIAQLVGIATRTVEFHLTNTARKLGAVNKINAVAIATAAGLVRP